MRGLSFSELTTNITDRTIDNIQCTEILPGLDGEFERMEVFDRSDSERTKFNCKIYVAIIMFSRFMIVVIQIRILKHVSKLLLLFIFTVKYICNERSSWFENITQPIMKKLFF
jgi:hypothetical protein